MLHFRRAAQRYVMYVAVTKEPKCLRSVVILQGLIEGWREIEDRTNVGLLIDMVSTMFKPRLGDQHTTYMGLVITAERPELKIPGPHKAKIEGTCRLRSRGVAFRAVALIVANLVKAGLMQNMYFG